MPVAAPMSARGLWLNAYYKTDEEIVVALADALKEEYKAIVDAGFHPAARRCVPGARIRSAAGRDERSARCTNTPSAAST